MSSAPACSYPCFARQCVRFFLGAFLLSLGWHADAQQLPPAPPVLTAPRHHSLSLDAQLTASGGTSRPTQTQKTSLSNGGRSETEAMDDKKVTTSRQHLRYSVKNFDTQPDNVRLEWYFVAKPFDSTQAGEDFVFDHGSRAVSVAGGQTETQTLDSKEIQAVSERKSYVVSGQGIPLVSGHTTQRGSVSAGWMMRLTADGQIVAVKASTQRYEDIAKDEARLNELLAHRAPAEAKKTPRH